MNCTNDDDCKGPRLPTVDTGFAREERGYCGQCNPTTFARDWGSSVYVCPGYFLNMTTGTRVYSNGRPGTTVECLPDGSLVSGGTIDWERMEGVVNDGGSTTSTTTENPTREKNIKRQLAATLSMVLLGVCCICVGFFALGALVVWRTRPNSPYKPQA